MLSFERGFKSAGLATDKQKSTLRKGWRHVESRLLPDELDFGKSGFLNQVRKSRASELIDFLVDVWSESGEEVRSLEDYS